jgi:hypothetical protein
MSRIRPAVRKVSTTVKIFVFCFLLYFIANLAKK